MGLLRHMAIVTHNQRRLARFYHLIFGMEEVWNAVHNTPVAFYIGDGYFQINCLQIHPKITFRKIVDGKSVPPDPEINHIGFQVKSIDATRKRFADLGTTIKMDPSPRDGRYEEWRFTDPDGNLFELAEGTWDPGVKRPGMCPASYVGLASENPERLADFYKGALELKEINRGNGGSGKTIYLSDGKLCFAISGAPGVKRELTSLGFKVGSIESIKDRLVSSPPYLYPGEPRIEVKERASGPYKGWYLEDPDGNTVELSEEGWT